MEWTDALIKIGVGACLGFGIIALAKLARKKNNGGIPAGTSSRLQAKPDEHDTAGTKRNGP